MYSAPTSAHFEGTANVADTVDNENAQPASGTWVSSSFEAPEIAVADSDESSLLHASSLVASDEPGTNDGWNNLFHSKDVNVAGLSRTLFAPSLSTLSTNEDTYAGVVKAKMTEPTITRGTLKEY